jgi:phenylalanyl-tRNA synthetase alpha chain
MEVTINETQWNVFKTLLDSKENLTSHQVASLSGIDHTMIMGALLYAQAQNWLTIEEQSRQELILSENAADQMKKGFPERRILSLLADKKQISLRDLSQTAKEKGIPMNEIIKWGSLRGWVKKDKGELIITDKGLKAIDRLDGDERTIQIALQTEEGKIFLDELANHKIDADQVEKYLNNRPSIAKIKQRTIRIVHLTENGRTILSGDIKVKKERNVLTSEDITSGEWKNIEYRHYDITLEAEKEYPAKIHLMQKIIQQARKAFLEMGFTEIVSPQVESAFWDFDALFQPQDHPARDMQDTFYMSRPAEAKLPADDIVERIKLTHENGWETGSIGWGYQWDRSRAKQVVLRTHTTATTIRALAENPNPPRKVFCVGKVYRNEAISYKNLPEFFQVDGIIIDENASLATLLGTLAEFYRKMGFQKVKFKPGFFPYTEPSAEAFVYMESKKIWLELGGSGVFRPEVTRPFGCNVPVLAWGLGLDRLAMLRYGISDIREIFWSDLDKIREVSLCQ